MLLALALGNCSQPTHGYAGNAPERSPSAAPPSATATQPAPSPSQPEPAATSASNATPTTLRITVRGRKVGSRYIYAFEEKSNHKVYVLRADSESGQYLGNGTGSSTFVNPHVTFYGNQGERLVADAPVGTAFEKDKTIRMSGGVHARTKDGKTLTSDTLTYSDRSETIEGNGNVVLTSPAGDRLEGQHMVWDLRSGHIAMTGAQ